MTPSQARRLAGKRIARVDLHPFDTGRGSTACDPEILFDDGSSLCFVVVETDIGIYGIDPVYVAPPRKRKQK